MPSKVTQGMFVAKVDTGIPLKAGRFRRVGTCLTSPPVNTDLIYAWYVPALCNSISTFDSVYY